MGHLLVVLHLFMLSILLFNSLCCAYGARASYGGRRGRRAIDFGLEFEAIYQFGDSLSDTGNFIREPIGVNSVYKRLPYGRTYDSPTGRASDGLLMVDFIAMFFRLPPLNPYFASGSDFTHGVNFAVIGATANGGPNSLANQLEWFKSHLTSTFSDDQIAIREKLQKSLVLMGEMGGNDFNGPFYKGKSIKEVAKLVPGVVKTIKDSVEEVITLGANTIVVPGNFPIGCVPLYLARFATNDTSKYDQLGCLKDYNNFAKFYNKKLIKALRRLQLDYPGVAIVYGDYYSALTKVNMYEQELGFEAGGAKKACCGSGDNRYNYGTKGCGSPGAPVCEDPYKRVSWDGVHMTQHGNRCVAAFLLKQFVPEIQKQSRKHKRKPRH